MKVKVFYKQADDRVLEHQINDWLSDNSGIEILHIGQSHAFAFETEDQPARHDYEVIISIWYNE
ncbi:MAG TPA: hypothetical protein VKP65_17910 [Rhodothermales bacterium]|nr:hypothetical protein [Rhodothermales bacterium]